MWYLLKSKLIGMACVTLAACGSFGNGAEPPAVKDGEVKQHSPLRKLMDESLTWNELFVKEQADKPMTAQVAMRWANNARGSEDGMTVLFLADGRPEAVCCVYPWDKWLVHDFDSLSRGALIAKRDGRVVWHPGKPGVRFQTVTDADSPGDTPVARLRQMKALSSRFSSTMLGWKADKSDREPLRLLPTPLYRYQVTGGDVIDGAVFAFVQGTDPESLLLLEAIRMTDKRPEWQFAFARRTSGELDGRYNGSVVWKADRFPVNDDPDSTHFNLLRPLDVNQLNALKLKE